MISIESKVQVELVKQMYKTLPLMVWPEMLAATSLTIALWGAISGRALIGWLAFDLTASVAARLASAYCFQKSLRNNKITQESVHFWHKVFFVGVVFSGIYWGATGSVLLAENDAPRFIFQGLLLIGAVASGLPFYSPSRLSYIAYTLLCFTPLTVWFWRTGGIFYLHGVLGIVYMSMMIGVSLFNHNLLSKFLRFGFENAALLKSLSDTTDSLQQQTKELEKSHSLIKATLESTTDGIFATNEVINFNKNFLEMWKIPSSLTKKLDGWKTIMDHITDQLVDPQGFIRTMDDLLENPKKESFDEILFRDGRVFEGYSKPQKIGERYVGRVWSFKDITARKLMEKKLVHQANFDPLTDLPNRTLLLDRLDRAMVNAKRQSESVGILFLDLDDFKIVNDRLGHSVGDKLLIEVSQRLRTCIRENDTISRHGGDEFVIVCALKNEKDILILVKRCFAAIEEPFLVEGHTCTLSISIGVSFYQRDGLDPGVLIHNADVAMYRAKKIGRNTFQFFTEKWE